MLVMLTSGAAVLASAVAVGQFSHDVPTGFCRSGLLRDAPCEPGALVRAVGTFANPNLLAALLLLFAPLCVLAVSMVSDRTARMCVIALAVVCYAGIFVTFSRAAYLGALAGLLVLAWWHLRPRLSPARVRLAGWAGAGALAVALAAIAVASQAGRSLGVRGEAWRAALSIALDHPLGVGLGHAGAVVNARIDGSVEFQHVHNLWLNWLVETGPLGLLAITVITGGAVVTAVGLARRGDAVGHAGLAALTGFLIMNLLDHPTNLSRIAVAFWLVLALMTASAPARWRGPATRRRRHAHPVVIDTSAPTESTMPIKRQVAAAPAGPVSVRQARTHPRRRVAVDR